jgi:hypothetical protein
MNVTIRNAIAAAAIAALFAPAGFAQTPTPSQQDPKASCDKLTGMARENCLDKLRAQGKVPPRGNGTPSAAPSGSTPPAGSPSPAPR